MKKLLALFLLSASPALAGPNTTQPTLVGGMAITSCTQNSFIIGGGANAAVVCPNIVTNGDSIFSIPATAQAAITTAAFTSSRAWTLPTASAFGAGNHLFIIDAAGAINATDTLVITRAGGDTINGGTTVAVTLQYGVFELISDGTSKWTINISGSSAGTVTSRTTST